MLEPIWDFCIMCLLFFWRMSGFLADIIARYQEEYLKLQPLSHMCLHQLPLCNKEWVFITSHRMHVRLNMTFSGLVLPFIDGLDLFGIFCKTTLWWTSCLRHLIVAAPFCAQAVLCLFMTCLFKSIHMLIVTLFFFLSCAEWCSLWNYELSWMMGK